MRIALTGKMRSGKDTVANYLVDYYDFHRFAFADGIRKVCSLAFPQVTAQGKHRKLYQGVGQDFRKYDPDVWIKYTFHEIGNTVPAWENIIITDMRQPNEYKALRNKGFWVVKLNAADKTRLERMRAAGDNFDLADLNHETEQYFDVYAVDYEIYNDGSLEDLGNQVDTMVAYFKERGCPLWVV